MPDWAREIGSLCIILVDSGAVSNILFEDIVILQENSYAINCMVFKDRWSTDKLAGKIEDITFENIQIAETAPLHFWGYSPQNTVEKIVLENVFYHSEKPSIVNELRIETNQCVENIE